MGTIPKYESSATWIVDDLGRLRRFLRLGTEDSSSYSIEDKDVTLESSASVLLNDLISADRREDIITEISRAGQEVGTTLTKQKPVIFALVYCAKFSKDIEVRRKAANLVHEVCNIPTQLFSFVEVMRSLSNKTSCWGRSQRKAIAGWYNSIPALELASAVTQFRQQAGWSHLDILRLAHVKPSSDEVGVVLKYVSKGLTAMKEQYQADDSPESIVNLIAYLEDVEELKHTKDQHQAACLIEKHSLGRKHIPTWMVRSEEVWRALLQHMPYDVMLTHLGKMTAVGILNPAAEDKSCIELITERLRDESLLQQSKLHPFSILMAWKTYARGKAERGKLTWSPTPAILENLSQAFYESFKTVLPTKKKHVLAVDVSKSMQYGKVVGCPQLTPIVAAAAHALLLARTEETYDVLAFSKQALVELRIDATMSLDQIQSTFTDVSMGGVDCSQPIRWAQDQNKAVDVFMVVTDCESWAGDDHPADVLRRYRTALNVPEARLIVCAVASTGFSLADPQDAGMLDVAGLDAAVPHIIRQFVMGDL